jgi:Flavodoxin
MQFRVLVTYATRSGSTEEVARMFAEQFRSHDLAVDLRPAKDVLCGDSYDAIVIAVPLYMGKMHKDMGRFLSRNRAAVEKAQTALFVLGPVQKAEKDWDGASTQVEKELKRYPWLKPVVRCIVGGRFDPGRLWFPFNLIPALRKIPASDVLDWELIREQGGVLAQRFESAHANVQSPY